MTNRKKNIKKERGQDKMALHEYPSVPPTTFSKSPELDVDVVPSEPSAAVAKKTQQKRRPKTTEPKMRDRDHSVWDMDDLTVVQSPRPEAPVKPKKKDEFSVWDAEEEARLESYRDPEAEKKYKELERKLLAFIGPLPYEMKDPRFDIKIVKAPSARKPVQLSYLIGPMPEGLPDARFPNDLSPKSNGDSNAAASKNEKFDAALKASLSNKALMQTTLKEKETQITVLGEMVENLRAEKGTIKADHKAALFVLEKELDSFKEQLKILQKHAQDVGNWNVNHEESDIANVRKIDQLEKVLSETRKMYNKFKSEKEKEMNFLRNENLRLIDEATDSRRKLHAASVRLAVTKKQNEQVMSYIKKIEENSERVISLETKIEELRRELSKEIEIKNLESKAIVRLLDQKKKLVQDRQDMEKKVLAIIQESSTTDTADIPSQRDNVESNSADLDDQELKAMNERLKSEKEKLLKQLQGIVESKSQKFQKNALPIPSRI